MTAPGTGVGKAMAGDADPGTKSARTGRPPLEKPENHAVQASASGVPVTPSPLQDEIEKLATPVAPSADAALTQAKLEALHTRHASFSPPLRSRHALDLRTVTRRLYRSIQSLVDTHHASFSPNQHKTIVILRSLSTAHHVLASV